MEETKQTYKNVVGGAGSSTESEHANTHIGYQYAAAAFSSHYPSVTYYLAFASLINAHMLLIATYHPMCYLASHSLGPTTSMLPISHSPRPHLNSTVKNTITRQELVTQNFS